MCEISVIPQTLRGRTPEGSLSKIRRKSRGVGFKDGRQLRPQCIPNRRGLVQKPWKSNIHPSPSTFSCIEPSHCKHRQSRHRTNIPCLFCSRVPCRRSVCRVRRRYCSIRSVGPSLRHQQMVAQHLHRNESLRTCAERRSVSQDTDKNCQDASKLRIPRRGPPFFGNPFNME